MTDEAAQTPNERPIQDERAYVEDWIEELVAAYPKRRTTSAQEAQAQQRVKREFESLGLETEEESFRFNDHLYANLALHFGLAVAGTAALPTWPWLALLLHTAALVSYVLDSTHKMYLLRRLFPWGQSSNILGRMPATKPLRLRLILPAHIDAAFTGWLFHPSVVKRSAHPPLGIHALNKQLRLVCLSILLLLLFDMILLLSGWAPMWLLYLLTLPALIATLLNLQVVARNETVPGANDNLTGIAALTLLASRLKEWKPDDVEIVFVSTGAEEASLGGADALCRAHLGEWDKERSVVLALDSLSGGTLRYFLEGEVIPVPIHPQMRDWVLQTKAKEERFAEVAPFIIPAGATDALPFASRGYRAVCLGCVDPNLGTPQHYHLPSDIPAHLDYDKILFSIDFAEELIKQIEREMKAA